MRVAPRGAHGNGQRAEIEEGDASTWRAQIRRKKDGKVVLDISKSFGTDVRCRGGGASTQIMSSISNDLLDARAIR